MSQVSCSQCRMSCPLSQPTVAGPGFRQGSWAIRKSNFSLDISKQLCYHVLSWCAPQTRCRDRGTKKQVDSRLYTVDREALDWRDRRVLCRASTQGAPAHAVTPYPVYRLLSTGFVAGPRASVQVKMEVHPTILLKTKGGGCEPSGYPTMLLKTKA